MKREFPPELAPFLTFAPDDQVKANEAHAKSLGLKRVTFSPMTSEKLAIVGGGPSIKMQWPELKEYRYVFAINGAYEFLLKRGIEAAFVSVDHSPLIANFCRNVKRAIIATRCAPETFAALKDADVRVFDVPGDVVGGSATAITIIDLAAKMGFGKVTLFGCESSFKGQTHAYTNEAQNVITVRADSREFASRPDLYLHARELSAAIRLNPGVITERSGGLLRAMVRDANHQMLLPEAA